MNSLRQEVVGAVVERFRSILVAGGYQTDAGKNLFLWKATPLQQADLPGIILRDRRCETRLEGRLVHEHRIFFEADLYCLAGADVRALLADVQSAIAKDLRWQSGGKLLAVDTQPLDDELEVAQEERLVNACRVRFQVIVRSKPFNPFQLASPN